ncbi:hypothetical protein CLF_111945 [Clonorchis sinensis]|uniref:Uncharacterized protein n=1 Tax=Clonorchis sinensis TaxID=79923 RepID=G7YVK8_CLOSI|nr:hypothetical protein CLF_111945 [Clonorchis sinensis]
MDLPSIAVVRFMQHNFSNEPLGFPRHLFSGVPQCVGMDHLVFKAAVRNLQTVVGHLQSEPFRNCACTAIFRVMYNQRTVSKLLKEFEKNVAPILQLSGLDIHMVYSDNDAEIKDFVSVLDPAGTDGVLIASDDHVLQKIAMIPDQASPNLALSDVNGGASPAPPTRQTCALLGLEWSIWRDVELGGGVGASKSKSKPIDTNEHRGLLSPLAALSPLTWKRHLGVIWRHGLFWITSTNPTSSPNERFPVVQMASESLISTAPTPKRRLRVKQAKITYTPACEGCSKCWDSNLQNEDSTSKGPVKRKSSTFSQLFGLSRIRTQANTENSGNVEPTEPVEDRSGVVNEECGREYTIELRNVSSVVLALDKNEFYWIDNDHFEACPITARVRRNAISIYQ